MNKAQLLELVSTKSFDKEKIIGWINLLPSGVTNRKPTVAKVGDVFMHPNFLHPYVLLEQKDTHWICGLLTSEPSCTEILEPCKSRFFSDSYFTRTLITTTEVKGSFMNVYENTRHLKKTYNALKELFR